MREPSFWWQRDSGWPAAALSPLASIYGVISGARMARTGTRAPVPVICVGNFTLGGSGKTPTAMTLARLLTEAGHKPMILSRGYGGDAAGPLMVDPLIHNATQTGDEALLLAHAAPTIVARDRIAGARMAAQYGATVIVMDDGLQNSSLQKNFALAVIDGQRGIGNGKVFPAGPLRAPMATQWSRIHALLVISESDSARALIAEAQSRAFPVFYGRLQPNGAAVVALQGHKALAFAGIGNPDKFFATIEAAGIAAPVRKRFSDHHVYSNEEAADLLMKAEHEGLDLVTTEKDLARMSGRPGLAALKSRARALPVTLGISEEPKLRDLILSAIRH
ncbi:MAG: tetraacyldisaccharide 4'-kinase [Pseudolabrys sp.]|nr:tetraacyldisaccharide 4'-kinase [Pseudolabrys sp.]MBV9260385.1 tetraacyldisaccharide 4'-kinase [Pseudolabrys sp.]